RSVSVGLPRTDESSRRDRASCFHSLLHLKRQDGNAQRFNFPEISAADSLLLLERERALVCDSPLSRKMLVVGTQILKHFDRFMLVHQCHPPARPDEPLPGKRAGPHPKTTRRARRRQRTQRQG